MGHSIYKGATHQLKTSWSRHPTTQSWPSVSLQLTADDHAVDSLKKQRPWGHYLEDHPRTCKWLITMVIVFVPRAGAAFPLQISKMTCKWGWSLPTYKTWDDPASRTLPEPLMNGWCQEKMEFMLGCPPAQDASHRKRITVYRFEDPKLNLATGILGGNTTQSMCTSLPFFQEG